MESQSALQLKSDGLHRKVQRMGVFPNLEITLRVDRRLDYPCESKNKSKCFVFPVYLVFHPICLKGKWWEGRKRKRCSLALRPSLLHIRWRGDSSPITCVLPRVWTLCCSDSLLCCFRDGLCRLNSEETTTYHPWVWGQGGAVWCPTMTFCSFLHPASGQSLVPSLECIPCSFINHPGTPYLQGRIVSYFSRSLSDFSLPQQFLLPRNSEPLCPTKGIPLYIVTHSPCDIPGTVESPCNISCVSAVGCKLFENIC